MAGVAEGIEVVEDGGVFIVDAELLYILKNNFGTHFVGEHANVTMKMKESVNGV